MAKAEYKYSQDIIRKTKEYISSAILQNMELPTVEGLALLLEVDDDTLNEWAKKHSNFAKEFKRLKMSQKVQLINGGAFGGKEVNASMFIFLLKVNHGMVETEHVQHSGNFAINIDELIGLSKSSTKTTDSSSDTV